MSIQETCDNCGSDWNADSIIYIEYKEQNLCPICINELIFSMHILYNLIKNEKSKTALS